MRHCIELFGAPLKFTPGTPTPLSFPPNHGTTLSAPCTRAPSSSIRARSHMTIARRLVLHEIHVHVRHARSYTIIHVCVYVCSSRRGFTVYFFRKRLALNKTVTPKSLRDDNSISYRIKRARERRQRPCPFGTHLLLGCRRTLL